jgi:uncharacterized protein (DUF433 family)
MILFEQATVKDPEILGGTLCFRGTRVPVRILFDYLEGGHDLDYFLEGYPGVTRDQTLAVLDYAASSLDLRLA